MTYRYDDDVQPEDFAILNRPEALIEVIGQQLAEDLKDIKGVPVVRRNATRILRTPSGGLVNIFHDVLDSSGNNIAFNFDKIAVNQSVYLVSSSFFHDFNSNNIDLINSCKQQGLDCSVVKPGSTCQLVCDLAINWLYLMTAQHLTSFVDFDTRQATAVPLQTAPDSRPPIVQFQNAQVEYDKSGPSGQPGLIIHLQFGIQNMRNVLGRAVAYFYSADGQPLYDMNQLYNSTDGQVITWADFTPNYPDTRYDDLQLFLPYSELHVTPGQWQLRYRIVIFDLNNQRPIATSPDFYFNYTQY